MCSCCSFLRFTAAHAASLAPGRHRWPRRRFDAARRRASHRLRLRGTLARPSARTPAGRVAPRSTQVARALEVVGARGTLMREREQSAHTSWPHARQWCRRRSSPHLPPHSRQCVDTASLSHCTPYLASCVLAPREPPSKRERRRRGRPARSSACTGGRASCRERRCRRACAWAARGW